MQLSHRSSSLSARFDEPSVVSPAGLVPVLALAERAGLRNLIDTRLTVPGDKGAHAGSKVPALVAGMVAGADSIEDMHLLRHGGMGRLFTGLYAPSTLGSFLRSFAFGHVRQLDAVAAGLVADLAARTPLLSDAGQIAYLDVDDTIRATYGYAKQGAGYGYSGVKGLNALIAAVSTPSSAPVIVGTRPRKGSANSARGAARLVADALTTSRACGANGLLVVRADSAFYGRDVIAAIGRAKARFSITARQDVAVKRAIAGIGEDAWTTIRYPHAIFDRRHPTPATHGNAAPRYQSTREPGHGSARVVVVGKACVTSKHRGSTTAAPDRSIGTGSVMRVISVIDTPSQQPLMFLAPMTIY